MKTCTLAHWRGYDEALALSKQALTGGKLCVLPTDTLYGLAANALDEKAVRSVFAAKKRDKSPLSVIVSDSEMLQKYAVLTGDLSGRLQLLLPGPFTIILKAKEGSGLAPDVSTDGTIGIRIPHFIFTTTVVRQLGFPVTATSANLHGGAAPSELKEVPLSIRRKAGACVDGGRTRYAEGSTIIDLTKDPPVIIRKGAELARAEEFIESLH